MKRPHKLLDGLPRHVRRSIIAVEDKARQTGNWGQWQTMPMPEAMRLATCPNGWLRSCHTVHKTVPEWLVVMVRTVDTPWGLVEHAIIRLATNAEPTWSREAAPQKRAVRQGSGGGRGDADRPSASSMPPTCITCGCCRPASCCRSGCMRMTRIPTFRGSLMNDNKDSETRMLECFHELQALAHERGYTLHEVGGAALQLLAICIGIPAEDRDDFKRSAAPRPAGPLVSLRPQHRRAHRRPDHVEP